MSLINTFTPKHLCKFVSITCYIWGKLKKYIYNHHYLNPPTATTEILKTKVRNMHALFWYSDKWKTQKEGKNIWPAAFLCNKQHIGELWLTWVGSHWYVRGVIFPRREVTGMLHGAVARGSDPRGGSVHQGAALRQEMRRSSEIPSFHADKIIPNPEKSGKSNATHILILSSRSMCCIQSIPGFPQRRSPRSSFL